jgi:FkbM family methyltransferase
MTTQPKAELSAEAIRALVGPSPVLLEIGCNDGTDTLKFLEAMPEATVYCFEPDLRAIARFKTKVNDPRVTLVEAAIGDIDGQATFYPSSGQAPPEQRTPDAAPCLFLDEWDLSGSLRKPTGHLKYSSWTTFPEEKRHPVRVMTLDTWVQTRRDIACIDFVWADVQGAEDALIRGGQFALSMTRYFYTEFYDKPLYEGQVPLKTIQAMLPNFELPHQIAEIGSLLHKLCNYMRRTVVPSGGLEGECGEVPIIREHLPPGVATYVDVGAGPAVSCSNTWAFYQEGWDGLLIEPLPTFWYDLLRLRPRDRLCPIGVTNAKGFRRLRAADGASSMNPTWPIAEHAERIVETDTLANILDTYPAIRDSCELCSIDVEGLEREVLEGIDWSTFHPAVFVVEYRKFAEGELGEDMSGQWEHLLLAQGYSRVGETRLNYIYAKVPHGT